MPSSQFGPFVPSLRQLCRHDPDSAYRGSGGLCQLSGECSSRDSITSFQPYNAICAAQQVRLPQRA